MGHYLLILLFLLIATYAMWHGFTVFLAAEKMLRPLPLVNFAIVLAADWAVMEVTHRSPFGHALIILTAIASWVAAPMVRLEREYPGAVGDHEHPKHKTVCNRLAVGAVATLVCAVATVTVSATAAAMV